MSTITEILKEAFDRIQDEHGVAIDNVIIPHRRMSIDTDKRIPEEITFSGTAIDKGGKS